MEPWLIVLITVVGLVALRFLLLVLLSGGDMDRVKIAIRAGRRTVRDRAFADKVKALLEPPPPPRPSGAPLRLLALLQREGRLIDFLLEDLSNAPADLIVAGVKDLHPKCQKALKEHLVLEPVLAGRENDTVEVKPGFDPSAISLTGNVTGEPPFRGALEHAGWRVKEIKLAPPPAGQDEFILQPAVVVLP